MVSVGLLACQCRVVRDPLRHMTADLNRENNTKGYTIILANCYY